MTQSNKTETTPQTTPTSSPTKPRGEGSRNYLIMGVLSAVFALFILPEIFGAAAILLGAYVWRLDFGKPRHIGAWVIILGIVFMLVGLYYTSLIALYDFLP